MKDIKQIITNIIDLSINLYDRQDICKMIILALVADESIFLYGPPGTAKSSFEITQIKDYIDKAKKDKDIQKLAEIIGKHGGRTEKKQNFTDSFKPAVAYDGITYSDDIRNIVPSELALHRNKTTNLFFLEKLADKQLQTYKLGNDKSYSNNGLKKKGPIIVCIDTSGSMDGEPEKIAKTMVVAIAMIAKKEKRSAFIINFSDTYESLEIGTKDSLEKLHSFLSKSFMAELI